MTEQVAEQTTVKLSPLKYAVCVALLIILVIVGIWLVFEATPWLNTLALLMQAAVYLVAIDVFILAAAIIGAVALLIQERQDRRQSTSTPE
jgi:predicted branched-subunit amino acid permease